MTTSEAIKIAEGLAAKGREAFRRNIVLVGAEADRWNLELLDALLEAAKQGTEWKSEKRAEENEKASRLEKEAVLGSVRQLELTVREVENDELCIVSEGERFGMVLEPVLHASLAALRKVCVENDWDVEEERFEIKGGEELPEEVLTGIRKLAADIVGDMCADAEVIRVDVLRKNT